MTEEISGTHADNDTDPFTALDLDRLMWMVESLTFIVRDRAGLSLPGDFLPWAEEFAMKVVALLPPEELEEALLRTIALTRAIVDESEGGLTGEKD